MKLEIKNISKQYGKKTVLQGVSQEFSGGVYGLLGPNGAGKTTLLNIIATVLKASAGTICYEQKNVFDDLAGYHSMVGYLPQKIGFYTHFTGYDMMKYMHYLKGGDRKNTRQIDELLQRVNLYDVKDNKIATYSGGMKQRLLIAQALLNEPDVLVLDEPTAGLDPKERIRIRNFISEIAADKIVLLATHVVTDVECIAKEIILLKQGRILKKASPMELIREMDGLVWEFLIQPEEMAGVQKKYLVSNIMMTDAGMLVRAVGNGEQFPAERKKAAANMEDVYLYRMEADIG